MPRPRSTPLLSPLPTQMVQCRAWGLLLKELVDALIPYTERHLTRMEKLLQDSYVVEHLLSEMDDGMFGELGDGDEDVDNYSMDIDRAITVSA